jgi:hypothetical protein
MGLVTFNNVYGRVTSYHYIATDFRSSWQWVKVNVIHLPTDLVSVTRP